MVGLLCLHKIFDSVGYVEFIDRVNFLCMPSDVGNVRPESRK